MRQKRCKTCRIFHQILKSVSELPIRILQWKICFREVVYFISLLCCQLALTKGSDKSKLANPLAYKNPHCIKDLTRLRTYDSIIKRTEKKNFMLVSWKVWTQNFYLRNFYSKYFFYMDVAKTHRLLFALSHQIFRYFLNRLSGKVYDFQYFFAFSAPGVIHRGSWLAVRAQLSEWLLLSQREITIDSCRKNRGCGWAGFSMFP